MFWGGRWLKSDVFTRFPEEPSKRRAIPTIQDLGFSTPSGVAIYLINPGISRPISTLSGLHSTINLTLTAINSGSLDHWADPPKRGYVT